MEPFAAFTKPCVLGGGDSLEEVDGAMGAGWPNAVATMIADNARAASPK